MLYKVYIIYNKISRLNTLRNSLITYLEIRLNKKKDEFFNIIIKKFLPPHILYEGLMKYAYTLRILSTKIGYFVKKKSKKKHPSDWRSDS